MNTDLCLIADEDIAPLAGELGKRGVRPLYDAVTGDDGLWYCSFEISSDPTDPDSTIEIMLDAIETLEPTFRRMWDGCSQREFNIGYDCGDEPWAFNQGLTSSTLSRMAKAGGSLRVTLYPARPDEV